MTNSIQQQECVTPKSKNYTRSSRNYPARRSTWQGKLSSPLVNIWETDDAFDIELALPGVTKDQINLSTESGVLTVTGLAKEVQDDTESTERELLRRQFDFAGFERKFEIPKSVDSERISANMKDGILTIQLPKKEDHKPRTISVK